MRQSNINVMITMATPSIRSANMKPKIDGLPCREPISCAGCLNNIHGENHVGALGQAWHKECFRCSICDSLLSSWYLEKGGLLFCQTDYWARYGENCHQCEQVITGPVMAAGEHRYHPECFSCVACGAHIEDAEPYTLVERTTLYCGSCYKSSSGHVTSHSIRSVVVPPSAFRLSLTQCTPNITLSHLVCAHKVYRAAHALLCAAFSLCIQLTRRRIDSSCGLLTLHIGDRILEINGTPVTGRSREEVERALTTSRSDSLVQLTLERNSEPAANENVPTRNVQTENTIQIKPESSPVERRIQNIPKIHSEDSEESACRRERLFKRRVECGGGKVRVIRRRQTPSSPLLGEKEKSSSMSKLLDVVDGEQREGVLCDLSRARSFRTADPLASHRVFRASDLLQGELLGAGFFGQVYKVTHRDTNEVMVLKQLYRLDETAQRNFLKEVAVLRSLQHPNVLRFVGVLYKDKRLHLVTEYVAGGTLHQLLQDDSVSLSWSERGRLARDVAAGVGYLHRMNVIHRDLNSHNCLVREDKTVIVADFGLARIVQRTASSARQHATLRRKRYTVVGNPYWMAPEMMNGNVYDEKVDVFSFGIILCEIIGRVSADPDFLPRRMDFGLNETAFMEQFCRTAPEPFYRVAFLACDLDPDRRPKFEVIEIWLESITIHLSKNYPIPDELLVDIVQYAEHASHKAHSTPECCPQRRHGSDGGGDGIFCAPRECCRDPHELTRSGSSGQQAESEGESTTHSGVIKSKSNAMMLDQMDVSRNNIALGKCVSASHICQPPRPIVTVTDLSRSHSSLHAPGFILRADGNNINITKVADITKWLDPPQQLKRTSPDSQLNQISQENKTRKVVEVAEGNFPAFFRNQSVDSLETKSKHDVETPLPICRHFSIPDNCEVYKDINDTESSDDDLQDISDWYRNVSSFKKLDRMTIDSTNNIFANIIKKGENALGKKSSYDVTDSSSVCLRNPGERKVPEVDCKRFNIDYLSKSQLMAVAVKNIPKMLNEEKSDKPAEKSNSFAKKLLSPKLSRLFKANSTQVVRNKPETVNNVEDKSKSKFFIQRPTSPSNVYRSSYRVRPLDEDRKPVKLTNRNHDHDNILKSDLKLASMGKPMTPIFRRNVLGQKPEFADGRFSYRDKKPKIHELKHVDVGRPNIKTPVDKNVVLSTRGPQRNIIPSLTTVPEKKINNFPEITNIDKKPTTVKKREPGISRSNYVSLANLKINSKKEIESKVNDNTSSTVDQNAPVERVI